MAVNLTTKFSDKVAERFSHNSFTDSVVSKEYEWIGAKTIKVYSIDTAPLQDYTIGAGLNSYGDAHLLGDTVQEMSVNQDKAFRFYTDKGNDQDQLNIKRATENLKRETDEVITPYVDKYRFNAWGHGAGIVHGLASDPDANSIVGDVMDCTADMDNELVSGERTMFVAASYYKYLKQTPDFIGSEGLVKESRVKGEVGEIDGMRVIKVPDSWLPAGVYWLITTKNSVLGPVKLQDYKIHRDPPGLNGNLCEGRVRQDAFVLAARASGVLACVNNSYTIATPTVTNDSTNSAVKIAGATGTCIYYTTDGSDPRYSESATNAGANTASLSYATLNNATGGTGGVVIRAAAMPNTNKALFPSALSNSLTY